MFEIYFLYVGDLLARTSVRTLYSHVYRKTQINRESYFEKISETEFNPT